MAKKGDTDRPTFTETLRAIDDSDLDVYEFRLAIHIWRVGVSWESMRTMAAKCDMSAAKVCQVQKSLIEKGFLVHQERGGRVGLAVVIRSPHEQTQQLDSSDCSLSEQGRLPHEQNVHHVNAILNEPYKSTNEDYAPSPEPSQPSDPLAAIRAHFTTKTALLPNDRAGTYERDWHKPLEAILELTANDPAAAIALIDRALAVARGDNEARKVYTVTCPRSLMSIAANLAAAGKVTAMNGDADTIWQQVRAALNNGFNTAPQPLQVAMKVVGWPRIKEARERDVPQLKQEVFNAYRNVAAV